MPQILRPSATLQAVNWTGDHTDINDVTPNSATVTYGNVNTSGANLAVRVALTGLVQPNAGARQFRFFANKVNASGVPTTGGQTVDLALSVFEERTPGVFTNLGTVTYSNLPGTANTWLSYTANWNEGLGITDYSKVAFQWVQTISGAVNPASVRRAAGIIWAELEIPDGGIQPVVFDGVDFTLTGGNILTPAGFAQGVQQGEYQIITGDVQSFQSYNTSVDSVLVDVDGNPIGTSLSAKQVIDLSNYVIDVGNVDSAAARNQGVDGSDYQIDVGDVEPIAAFFQDIDDDEYEVSFEDVELIYLPVGQFDQAIDSALFQVTAGDVDPAAGYAQDVGDVSLSVTAGDVTDQVSLSQAVDGGSFSVTAEGIDLPASFVQDLDEAEFQATLGDINTQYNPVGQFTQDVDSTLYQADFEDVTLQVNNVQVFTQVVDGAQYSITFEPIDTERAFAQSITSTLISVTGGQVDSVFVPKPPEVQDVGSGSFIVQTSAVSLNVRKTFSQRVITMDLVIAIRKPRIIHVIDPPRLPFIGRPRTFDKPLLGQATGQGKPFF